MTPDYLLKRMHKFKTFRQLLNDIEQSVNKNVANDYKLWGDKTFIPIDRLDKIIKKYYDVSNSPEIFADMIGPLFWHFCKSRYVFDKTLFKNLIESSRKSVPIKSFLYLKEWALYLDTKGHGLHYKDIDVDGVLMYIVKQYDDDHMVLPDGTKQDKYFLRINIIGYELNGGEFYTFALPIVLDDIEQTLQLSKAISVIEHHKWNLPQLEGMEATPEKINILSKVLNLALYILCQNSRIENKNDRRKPFTATKQYKRVFSPRDVKTWHIRDQIQTKEMDITKGSTIIMPHIRRGHFHSYWIGPRDNPTDIVVKWIPPIYVNASKVKENAI